MKVSTVNEKDDESSTNLMSVMHMDVFNIQLVMRKLHDFWASLLMIILSGYLIIKMLGFFKHSLTCQRLGSFRSIVCHFVVGSCELLFSK
jgi:hypothetical protein